MAFSTGRPARRQQKFEPAILTEQRQAVGYRNGFPMIETIPAAGLAQTFGSLPFSDK